MWSHTLCNPVDGADSRSHWTMEPHIDCHAGVEVTINVGEFRQAWLPPDSFAGQSASGAATLASLICPFVDPCFDFFSPGSNIGPHLGPFPLGSIGGFLSSRLASFNA